MDYQINKWTFWNGNMTEHNKKKKKNISLMATRGQCSCTQIRWDDGTQPDGYSKQAIPLTQDYSSHFKSHNILKGLFKGRLKA